MRIGIVGAGIAGLACAERLAELGHESVLFDKGRRPGGRLSTLTLDGRAWDFGAQYFTAADPRFAARVERWREAGLVSRWNCAPGGALVGVPAMSTLIETQCAGLEVHFAREVRRIDSDGLAWHVSGTGFCEGPFAAIVLAVPAEQAAALLSLHDLVLAREAASIRSAPCWTVLAAFAEPLQGVADALGDRGPIAWAARNDSKPGRPQANCWVIQAGASWSQAHLEAPAEEVAGLLLKAFAQETGVLLPATLFAKAHRWRFALPFGQAGAPLWNRGLRLGACGDWCQAPLIEGAWLSGHELAETVAAALVPERAD